MGALLLDDWFREEDDWFREEERVRMIGSGGKERMIGSGDEERKNDVTCILQCLQTARGTATQLSFLSPDSSGGKVLIV